MLNNKKIRTMTKLAIYEQNEGNEDIKMSKFYKSDYVRYHTLKNCIAVTVAYILILLMIAMYNSEYLIAEVVTMDYQKVGGIILGIYLILIALCVIGSIFGYSFQYEASRGRLARYYKRLRNLEKQYNEEKSDN